jgi:23S rRNA (guanine2445-N2)-methyltransferase / 23S rRNA (guanine2069-N7)-methyltransferase
LNVKETVGGVYGDCEWSQVYQVCLLSRFANRVVWVLDKAEADTKDEIYRAVSKLPWGSIFSIDKSFSVDFKGGNRSIKHTNYGALLVKDAVVDYFNELEGSRPNVDPKNADVQLYAHLRRNQITIGIDVSGGSLHRRGYRLLGAKAPLKENLAAALVKRANKEWDDDITVADPFCGSGTLLIEAMYQHLDIPSNLDKTRFGFEALNRHDEEAWQTCLNDLRNKKQEAIAEAKSKGIAYFGSDKDSSVVRLAKENIKRAGLEDLINVKQQTLQDFSGVKNATKGIVLSNPPYGERLDDKQQLFPLYQQIGDKLKEHCQGWKVAILCSEDVLLKALRLSKDKQYKLNNGQIEVFWQISQIHKRDDVSTVEVTNDPAIEMVGNRLRKNKKRIEKWARKNNIECYRVYDADMPEYAFALDCYGESYQLTEYKAPKSVDAFGAMQRRMHFEEAVKQVFELRKSQLFFKERKRQKGKHQYEKMEEVKTFFTVTEGQGQFLVNLSDYLDTGLFLDHRPVRKMIYEMAKGKRFLNLFCYTSAASVHAALGGATSSLSVDMSNTYLNWSERNFRKNRLDQKAHTTQRADVLQWIKSARDEYDLIFLDPPSFSNSKKMDDVLDIQRDHVGLVEGAMELLSDDGTLIFSNNLRGFKLDTELSEKFNIEDISSKTIDTDFERNSKIHQCWLLRHNQR